MFRVICIEGVKQGVKGKLGIITTTKEHEIYEGDIYTVCGYEKISDIYCYFLTERPKNLAYNIKRFIPLSDLDETIIHQETLLQTVK